MITLVRVGSIDTFIGGTWPEMHWFVVHGFDEGRRMIYYTDTDGGRYEMSYDEFLGQWGWGIGRGAASSTLAANGVETRTMVWVDRATASQGFQLGFYRQGNQPEVYLVFRSNGRHCHVQNPDQMNSFGGFGQVRSIQNLPFASSSGGFSGACGFPNGFYRLGNQAEVYRLYGGGIPEFNIGGSYCHVANPQQMEAFGGFGQVRSIATTSDLGRGREFTGTCQNP